MCGDFQKRLRALDRQAALIELSTEHADFFTQNLVAIRGAERVPLAIYEGVGLRDRHLYRVDRCQCPHARGREREEVVVSGNAVSRSLSETLPFTIPQHLSEMAFFRHLTD